jgi:hypothetical protein
LRIRTVGGVDAGNVCGGYFARGGCTSGEGRDIDPVELIIVAAPGLVVDFDSIGDNCLLGDGEGIVCVGGTSDCRRYFWRWRREC